MILSRVIEHVKQQHWTAVFLDFVIVVTGVFIGIQVSNWNAARADKRLGAEYATRLSVDLRTDLTSTNRQLTYYEEVLRAVHRTDELLKDPNADPEPVVTSAYRATEIMFTAPSHATWDQIVSSGHLALLPKNAAGPLAFYYSFDVAGDLYQFLAGSAFRRKVRQIIPIEIQAAMRAGCSDELDEGGNAIGFMKECRLEADAALVRSTAEALRRDPAVGRTLNYQYSDVSRAVDNLRANLPVLKRAIAVLGGTDGGN